MLTSAEEAFLDEVCLFIDPDGDPFLISLMCPNTTMGRAIVWHLADRHVRLNGRLSIDREFPVAIHVGYCSVQVFDAEDGYPEDIPLGLVFWHPDITEGDPHA